MNEKTNPEIKETPEKRVFMHISFHNISLKEAEKIKIALASITPPGVSYSVYFDDAIVVDEI